MKIIIQAVKRGWIKSWDDQGRLISVGAIKKGAIVYIGFCEGDNKDKINRFVSKIFKLPLFDDKNWKISLSVDDIKGELIIVPNFTLCGRNKKGNSLDYSKALSFKQWKELYNYLKSLFKDKPVYFGEFGSYMEIESVVIWPINLALEI